MCRWARPNASIVGVNCRWRRFRLDRGGARHGTARPRVAGTGVARPGEEAPGAVRHGLARQGLAGRAWGGLRKPAPDVALRADEKTLDIFCEVSYNISSSAVHRAVATRSPRGLQSPQGFLGHQDLGSLPAGRSPASRYMVRAHLDMCPHDSRPSHRA